MVLHVIHEKTSPRDWRHLLLRNFKCYSEITQGKHAWGCPVSTDGASQQWLQDFVVMPEPAADSVEPTKPKQEETGYSRLPNNMNCHSYTRSGKRHVSNASNKNRWFTAGLLTKRKNLHLLVQNKETAALMMSNFLQVPCLVWTAFHTKKDEKSRKLLFSAGALNDCLQLWTLF